MQIQFSKQILNRCLVVSNNQSPNLVWKLPLTTWLVKWLFLNLSCERFCFMNVLSFILSASSKRMYSRTCTDSLSPYLSNLLYLLRQTEFQLLHYVAFYKNLWCMQSIIQGLKLKPEKMYYNVELVLKMAFGKKTMFIANTSLSIIANLNSFCNALT